MDRRKFVMAAAAAAGVTLLENEIHALSPDPSGDDSIRISVSTQQALGPLPHIWEECVGSDRAAVGLRQQWLLDLETTKREIGFKSVRFHGLFDDEMGVWPPGTRTKRPSFLYVDMVFDAMIERGVKPLVELSFMPGALASGKNTAFFYKGNITPPDDIAEWTELIRSLAEHCVARYGIDQVSTWAFEVWNEPNLKFFWSGTQTDYFELYRHAASALKSVDKRLRVGGPSSAQAAWVGELLAFCSKESIPIDFASTHIYPDDPQAAVFGPGVHHSYEDVIPEALKKVKGQIKASQFPSLPLYVTEWSSQNPAFIAHTIRGTIGLADMLSYWTFDNIFEELAPPRQFLNNAFGLIGTRGLPRPSYYTFALMHKLGNVQLKTEDGPVLATKKNDGSLAILVWNLISQPAGQHTSTGDPALQTAAQYSTEGSGKKLILHFAGEHRPNRGHIIRVDANSGNFRSLYEQMGSPAYPSIQQIAELRKNSLPLQEPAAVNARGELSLSIPANGVALIELH